MMLQRFPRNRAARQFTTAATGAWNDTFFGDTRRHGFLPSQKPVGKLPTEFDVLENILQKMTCIQPDGTRSGLLAHNELGKTVDSDFPDLMHEIQKVDDSDQRMLAALFRDYSFLSSAYMLEPSHVHYLKTGNYGQVKYPRNSLTEYLFELREYRPSTHQGLIDWCKEQNKASNMNEFALQDSYSSFLMLCNVHATFRFRRQHWNMVQKYIIDNTKYPRATGGTPITTWLPNQMGACLEMCHELISAVKVEDLEAKNADEFKEIKHEIEEQTSKLMDEVNSYNKNEFAGVDQDLDEFEKRRV